jgi:hypothetical protein
MPAGTHQPHRVRRIKPLLLPIPHEPKYLYELITEARFCKLFGRVVLLEERIKDLCLCKLAVD